MRKSLSIFTAVFGVLSGQLSLASMASVASETVILAPQNPENKSTSPPTLPTKNVKIDPFSNLKKNMSQSRKIYLAQNTLAMNQNTYQQQNNFSSMKVDTDSRSEKNLGMTFQTGYSQSLYDRQDRTRERSMNYLVSPSYQVSQNYRLGALISGSSDLNGLDGSDFGRGQLSVTRKPWELISVENKMKSWSFTPALALGFPLSKSARDDQSYLLGLKPSLTISPSSEMIGSRHWDMSLAFTAGRNFHTYEITKSGSSNVEYSSTQSLILGYSLPKDFRLELSLSHFNAWTYQGTASEAYSHSEELSYKISQGWSLAGGHTYGNPVVNIYGPDGQTLNYGLVSEKYSYVYSNVTYTY